MKAMILAAGYGSRMGALVADTPKVLLKIGDKALIDYHLEKLAEINISEVVINLHYLPEKIRHHVGDGRRYQLKIQYCFEKELLGMGGGVYNALPLLGTDPFIVISGDMWTDYDYANLPKKIETLAHLVLADNPAFHLQGDFQLQAEKVFHNGKDNLNYAGFGVYCPELFANLSAGTYGITKLLHSAITSGLVSGEHYRGVWRNINTVEQLQQLRKQYEV